ncbi:MAG: hypothetical protein GX802_07340, partial [Clostridiales bacterium]|nr:hypothetical protein [Clostridiales bacterium]
MKLLRSLAFVLMLIMVFGAFAPITNAQNLKSNSGDVVRMAAGMNFCLAIKTDGSLWAWG